MYNQKSIVNRNLAIGIILVLILAATLYFFLGQNKTSQPQQSNEPIKQVNSGKRAEGYTGELLAGLSSPLLVFNQADYDKALANQKIIFLDFYANWCPICRAETPELYAGFDSLDTDRIVGFRVNYNDDQTDETEKALASQFGIIYQHTKVILQNGQVVLKTQDPWAREDFAEEVSEILAL